MPSTPLNTGDDPVVRQLEAYNARDLDAFVAQFAKDVSAYRYPDQLMYTGRDALREQFSEYFAAFPDLHCELVSRIRIGNQIIDEERVTRVAGKPALHAIAIYRVEGDVIAEMRFIMG